MNKRKLSFFGLSLLLPVVVLALLLTAVSPPAIHAAPNPIVNSFTDENDGECAVDCSLRDAIALADAGSTITFDASISGTIVLSSTLGDLVIDKNLTIDGGNVIAVSGNNATRVFNVTAGNVTFDSVDIISGTVTTADCAIHATQCGGGIMIQTSGIAVTVTNSTLSGNSANSGGGIYNYHSTLTINNSTFFGNSADDFGGGGIYNDGYYSYATLTVHNSSFFHNSANADGGGIYNIGTMTVTNSTFSGNWAPNGGGIINSYDGTATVSNSTLSGNSATVQQGGGIFNAPGALLAVSNSTLAGNSAANGGSGIANPITVGTVTVTNSIIANSPGLADCVGSITSAGYNLDSDDTCNLNATGDITNTNPLLGALADNGGDTLTQALLAGSLAIDAGYCVSGPVTDQRGVVRPIGAGCDIGAFESNAFLLTVGAVGLGSVTQDPPQADYAYGTVVTVAAVADTGWTYVGWSGHLSGSAISETVTITGNLAITATFSNDPPIADAGEDQVMEVNQAVTLDGTGSFDDDLAQTLTYGWVQTGGSTVILNSKTAVSPTFTTPANAAILTFTLVVTDSYGLPSTAANVAITVQEPGLAAQLATTPTTAQPGDVVWFTLTLTNTGDLILNNLNSVTDVGGNFTLPNSIDVGIIASYTYSYTVLPTDLPDPLTNVVMVTAQTPLGSGVSAMDTTAVVLEPYTIFLPIIFNH